MGHIRGTSRCARRGSASLTPLARALAKFGFFAPLTSDVFLDKGYGAASFTRATTATVKDHEGCIRNCLSGEVRFHGQRRVHNNSGSHTTDTTSVNGSVSNATFTTGVSDPDGGLLATTLTSTLSNGGGFSNVVVNYPAGAVIVVSVWIRRRTGTGNINLSAGGAANTNIASVVTSSWKRVSASFTATGSSPNAWTLTMATSGDAVDLYKIQSEVVTGQSNQNPSEYVSVGANLLNELTYTEEIDNAAWTKTGSTVTGGQATGPLGGANVADLFVEAASSTQHFLGKVTASIASGTALVCSIYAKKGPGATAPDWIQLAGGGSISATAYANFNLTTGLVGSSSGCTASMVSVGDGWYRLIMALSTTSTATASFFPCFTNNNDGLGRIPTYLGVVTSNVYVYGAQVEKGSAVTAYFPVGNIYPHHGACVDGVQYFSTLNGNTVASNVVTEATGAAITRPEGDGLTNGLVLPGTASNYASAPAAAYWPTGDIDIICRCSLADWTPSAQNALVSLWHGAGAQSFLVWVSVTGIARLYYSLDGTAGIQADATAAFTVSDAQALYVRITRNATTGKINVYQAPDAATVPSSWTQVGAEISGTAGALFSVAGQPLNIGSYAGSAAPMTGTFYRAIVKDGIDGTTVFDADFSAQPLGTTTFAESSSNAATVTVNKSGIPGAYIGNPSRVLNYEGYLAESSRTNLVLQSSNFGTTWTAVGTPTRSAAAAYCGEIALDLIGDDSAAVTEGYQQTVGFTADAAKSVSFLVKQGTSSSTVVRVYDSTAVANRLLMAITWSGGIPVCTYTTGSAERAPEAMANGCWRIFCATASLIAANTNIIFIYAATDAAISVANTGDIYIGGVQAENATTASVSHIPTTTATVTINKDELDFPAPGNATTVANSLYAECFMPMWPGGNPSLATVRNATERSAQLFWFSATAVNGYAFAGSYDDATSAGSPAVLALVKAVTAVAANDGMKAVKGTLGTADATVTVSGSAVTTIDIGKYSTGSQLNGVVRNIRVSSTRVPNADLQLITQ